MQTNFKNPPETNFLEIRAKARELESLFLSEMLSAAGLDAAVGHTGAGQFASFFRQAQANVIVRSRGIGLAEDLFNAMVRSSKHDG